MKTVAITSLKFEAYYKIRENKILYETKDKKLSDDSIIRIAKEEYDVILTAKDLKLIRKDYNNFMIKYIHNF